MITEDEILLGPGLTDPTKSLAISIEEVGQVYYIFMRIHVIVYRF